MISVQVDCRSKASTQINQLVNMILGLKALIVFHKPKIVKLTKYLRNVLEFYNLNNFQTESET